MTGTRRIAIALGLAGVFVAAVLWKESHKESHDVAEPTRASPATEPASSPPEAASDTAGIPRLVDLGSNKCIPCKMMAPILDELQAEYRGRFKVEVIDVREDRAAAQRHAVRVIPTQIFYDSSGEERFRHEGFMSKEAILDKWKELDVDLTGVAK